MTDSSRDEGRGTAAEPGSGDERLPDILFVEDELMIALELQGLVEDAGLARVHLAGDEETAWSLVADLTRLSAAILDVVLREGTTLPLAEEMRRRGIPIAFATGYEPGTGVLAQFPDAPVIAKPFDGPQLLATVGELIRSAGAERQKSPA